MGFSLVVASRGYSPAAVCGLLTAVASLLWSMGSRPVGFSSCSSEALEHRLNSCGTQASLPHSMWDLPRSGTEPMSPACTGSLFNTEPPRKPSLPFIFETENCKHHFVSRVNWGFPGDTSGEESSCQCRRCRSRGFNPWVRKIPCRRKWPPTPVFLPGESHGACWATVHEVTKSRT